MTGRPSALRFEQVHKRYGRAAPPALDGLSFEVPSGSITGLVGHNGAGKTTAFSLVCGFLRPDSGEIDILGRGAFDPHAMKGLVGVLPQDAELPDRHTPRELLYHLVRLQGLGARDAAAEVDRVLEAVQLTSRKDALIATLSHGMRRRVAVGSALVGRPPLVLLDEPMSGLDPVQAHALRRTLAALRGQQTLLVSSHDLTELERISDHVVMMKQGRCVRQGPIAEVTGRSLEVRWEIGPTDPRALLARLGEVLPDQQFRIEGDTLLQSGPEGSLDPSSIAVMQILAQTHTPLRSVRRGMGLEQRFIDDVLGEA